MTPKALVLLVIDDPALGAGVIRGVTLAAESASLTAACTRLGLRRR